MNWDSKQEVREYYRNYRNKNRQKFIETHREYRNRNQELLNAKNKEYRSRKALEFTPVIKHRCIEKPIF